MRHFFFLLATAFLVTLLQGCSSNDDILIPDEPQMPKLAAPILVDNDSTVIELSDYLIAPNQIDSLEIDPSFGAVISPDSLQMVIKPTTRDFPKLSVLKIWVNGFP